MPRDDLQSISQGKTLAKPVALGARPSGTRLEANHLPWKPGCSAQASVETQVVSQ